MLKIVLTLAVISAVYFFLIKKPKVTQHRQTRAAEKRKPKRDEEIMVECEKCGTFVSSHEAIIVDGKYYCSKTCAGVR
ncbi:PP0621 family protein [Hydrogenimonas urashimensis]|uniref:PP0621 family protein n=1 Tax=Hydrogenimonas urashimensis TaxID=2740515 RepID=UPI001915CB7B|nr:PP0621 family protein [Hydrogenimonas urashimensis]